ncbi:hypothetical protein WJX79_001437 [Trebouxia sp. C0005]
MQSPKRSVVAGVLGNLRQSIFGPQEPTSQATQADQEGSFDPLFPPQENQVSRGVNTQLAHLARVAAELKDLAGHVGQRAEGKLVARPDPRKSGIRSLQPSVNSLSRADVQPIREPLNLEYFSSAKALDVAKRTE